MINVIEQSTSDRKKATINLFNEIKPYLDEGMIYSKAVKIVKNLPGSYPCTNLAWFRDVVEYGESQGYSYKKHSGNAGRKKKKLI